MELWIRSQDRRYLIKTEYLYMVYDEENKKAYIGDKMAGHIGEYKTKERALEILDEIQKQLEPSYAWMPVHQGDGQSLYQWGIEREEDTIIYEMPKE